MEKKSGAAGTAETGHVGKRWRRETLRRMGKRMRGEREQWGEEGVGEVEERQWGEGRDGEEGAAG